MSDHVLPMRPVDLPEDDLDAQAEREIDAGQFVAHEDVMAWARSWGTPDEQPAPRPKGR